MSSINPINNSITTLATSKSNIFVDKANKFIKILDEIKNEVYDHVPELFKDTFSVCWYATYAKAQESFPYFSNYIEEFRQKGANYQGPELPSNVKSNVTNKWQFLYSNIVSMAKDELNNASDKIVISILNEINSPQYETVLTKCYTFILNNQHSIIKHIPQTLFGYLIFSCYSFVHTLDLKTKEGLTAFDTFTAMHLRCLKNFMQSISNVSAQESFKEFFTEYQKYDKSFPYDAFLSTLNNHGIRDSLEFTESTWIFNCMEERGGVVDAFLFSLTLCQELKDKELARNVLLSCLTRLDRGINFEMFFNPVCRKSFLINVFHTVKQMLQADISPDKLLTFNNILITNYIMPLGYHISFASDSAQVNVANLIRMNFQINVPLRYESSSQGILQRTESNKKIQKLAEDFYSPKSEEEYQQLSQEIYNLITLYRILLTTMERPKDLSAHLVFLMDRGIDLRVSPWKMNGPTGDLASIMKFVELVTLLPDVFAESKAAYMILARILSIYKTKKNFLQNLTIEEKQILCKCLLILGEPECDLKKLNYDVKAKTITLTSADPLGMYWLYCELMSALDESQYFVKAHLKIQQALEYIKQGKNLESLELKKDLDNVVKLREQRQKEIIEEFKKQQEESKHVKFEKKPEDMQVFEPEKLIEQEKVIVDDFQVQVLKHQIEKQLVKQDKNHITNEIQPEPQKEILIEQKTWYVTSKLYDILKRIFELGKQSPVKYCEVVSLFSAFDIYKKSQKGSHTTFGLSHLIGDLKLSIEEKKEASLVTLPYKDDTEEVDPAYLGEIVFKFKLLGIAPDLSVYIEGK